MEITQRDRDSLREAQQKKVQTFVIGNLVEHKIQNPAKYKALSRREQGLKPDSKLELPKVKYESKFLKPQKELHNLDKINGTLSRHDVTKKIDPDCERDLPINQHDVQANLWLNMDRVELDKLEWMSEKAEKFHAERLKTTTHFDSEGRAIAAEEFQKYMKQKSVTDNDCPDQFDRVHDLDNLILYLDSKFQPQVAYALGVISKIATRASTGYYDGVFNENIHELLIKSSLLRVRHHIDSPNETLCQNALRCLRSLICNVQIDEIFLDRMHPILSERSDDTLWLSDNDVGEKFEDDVDDNTCVKLDAILALIIRTNLLSRLEYLIKTKQGKFVNNYSDCVLDILIRLARHSRGVCIVMADTNLLELIVDKYLPTAIAMKSDFDQSLAIRAMKFIRIITQASRELSHGKMRMPQEIFSRLENYYYIDLNEKEKSSENLLFRTHIEALRLMKTLLKLDNLASHIHSIITISPNRLMQNLRIIATKLKSTQIVESRISLDWQWAAHTIDLAGHLMQYEHHTMKNSATQSIWVDYVKPVTLSWLVDLIRERFIPHLDISVTIYVAISHSLINLSDLDPQCILKVLLNDTILVKEPKENASLAYFNLLIRELEANSQLKNVLSRDGRLRDPFMLSSYGCLDFNSSTIYQFKLNSSVENDSPLVLLELFTKVLFGQSQKSCHDHEKYVTSSYANNLNAVRLLRCASRYFKESRIYESFVRNSFLIQREIQLMTYLTLMQVDYYMQGDITTERLESYSNLLLSAFSIIGLFNPATSELEELKDKLIDMTILNKDLHDRLANDTYRKTPTSKQFDLTYYNVFGLNLIGEFRFKIFDSEDIRILQPIYRTSEQLSRFWILQPLIEYYNNRLKDTADKEKHRDKKYFANIVLMHQALNIPLEDPDAVASVLSLHATIIHNSPAYNECLLRPNIEEFLCIIGTVFLDDDLFLHPRVSEALNMNLEILVAECIGSRSVFTDASKVIQSLDLPLNDFFSKLVDQYEACSYGDHVFTNFLLLFVAAKSDKSFKKKLFSEKVETCLAQMRLPTDKVWAPSNIILELEETDAEIRELIQRATPHIQPESFMSMYCRKQMMHQKK